MGDRSGAVSRRGARRDPGTQRGSVGPARRRRGARGRVPGARRRRRLGRPHRRGRERAGATVLRLPVNLGVGGALRCGFRYAVTHGYAVVVQCDADGQHDPAQIATLLDAMRAGPRRSRDRVAVRVGRLRTTRSGGSAGGDAAAGAHGVAAHRCAHHRRNVGLPGHRAERARALRVDLSRRSTSATRSSRWPGPGGPDTG